MIKIDYYTESNKLTDKVTNYYKKYSLVLLKKLNSEYRFNASLEYNNNGEKKIIGRKENISAVDVIKFLGENKTVKKLFFDLNLPEIYSIAVDEIYKKYNLK